MKQITNKQYEEYMRLQKDLTNGHIMTPETLRFICASNDYDPKAIGEHLLETLAFMESKR